MCKCEKCGAEYSIANYPCEKIKHYCSNSAPPNTATRLVNFTQALTRHITGGMKKANQQQIDARFAICQACSLFNGEICTHKKCGCNINNKEIFLNKLAWADQSCPIGKWGPIVD